ncbi:hypothetical protein KUTeg_007194, partial [Tegillarca granosa]
MEKEIIDSIDQRVQNAVQSSQNSLLSSLDRLISQKLSDFDTKFSDKQREMNASTLSKIEAVSSSKYVFKRKGNEEQYKHSVQLDKNSNRPVNARVTTQTNSTVKPGVCFACGLPGHWRKECLQKERTDKISIFDVDLSIVRSGEVIVNDDVKKVSAKNNLNSPVGRLKKSIEEKCDWKPKQYTTWLGCDWNFLEATVSITEDRIQRLLDNLNIVISQISSGSLLLKARTLASISGQIISMKSGI